MTTEISVMYGSEKVKENGCHVKACGFDHRSGLQLSKKKCFFLVEEPSSERFSYFIKPQIL